MSEEKRSYQQLCNAIDVASYDELVAIGRQLNLPASSFNSKEQLCADIAYHLNGEQDDEKNNNISNESMSSLTSAIQNLSLNQHRPAGAPATFTVDDVTSGRIPFTQLWYTISQDERVIFAPLLVSVADQMGLSINRVQDINKAFLRVFNSYPSGQQLLAKLVDMANENRNAHGQVDYAGRAVAAENYVNNYQTMH